MTLFFTHHAVCRHPGFEGFGSGERGLTLVELLVAMVIGSVLLTAVFVFFSTQSKGFADSRMNAEMQQEIRWASEYLSDRLKLAGNGVPTTTGWKAIDIVNGTGTSPDSVSVMGAFNSPVIVTSHAMTDEASLIECASVEDIETGDLAVISDGTFTEIFLVTGIQGNRLEHTTSPPWNDDNRLDHVYNAGSAVHLIEQYTFFVKTDDEGTPNLMVKNQSTGAQILAGGIEQFQVRFKLKSGDWTDTIDYVYDVREIEVYLRARSPKPVDGYHDAAYGDGYRRIELKTMVIPKNIIII